MGLLSLGCLLLILSDGVDNGAFESLQSGARALKERARFDPSIARYRKCGEKAGDSRVYARLQKCKPNDQRKQRIKSCRAKTEPVARQHNSERGGGPADGPAVGVGSMRRAARLVGVGSVLLVPILLGAQAAKIAGVKRVLLLFTADGPEATPSDISALKSSLESSGLVFSVVRTGKLVSKGTGGGLLCGEVADECADVPKEDIFRFVTEALTLEAAETRLVSLLPTADDTQFREMRRAGCDRREEAEALLKGVIKEKSADEVAAEEEAAAAKKKSETKTDKPEKETTPEELQMLLERARKAGEENKKRMEEERLRPCVSGFLSDLVRQCSEYDAEERCTFAHAVEQLSAPALRAEATRLPPGPAFLGGAVDATSLPAPPRAPVAKIHSLAARLPSSSALHAAADGQDRRSRRHQSALFGFHSDSAQPSTSATTRHPPPPGKRLSRSASELSELTEGLAVAGPEDRQSTAKDDKPGRLMLRRKTLPPPASS